MWLCAKFASGDLQCIPPVPHADFQRPPLRNDTAIARLKVEITLAILNEIRRIETQISAARQTGQAASPVQEYVILRYER